MLSSRAHGPLAWVLLGRELHFWKLLQDSTLVKSKGMVGVQTCRGSGRACSAALTRSPADTWRHLDNDY